MVAGEEVGVMGNLGVRRPVVGCIAWLDGSCGMSGDEERDNNRSEQPGNKPDPDDENLPSRMLILAAAEPYRQPIADVRKCKRNQNSAGPAKRCRGNMANRPSETGGEKRDEQRARTER